MKILKRQRDSQSVKWITGIAAATVASGASQAATVQISFSGNILSSSGGNQLYADLTGDGSDDVTIDDVNFRSNVASMSYALNVRIQGVRFIASYQNYFYASFGTFNTSGDTIRLAKTILNVTFTDSRINGGLATNGLVQVTARNVDIANHVIEINRLIFDDENTQAPLVDVDDAAYSEFTAIPEPSSLALLALGAAGVLARRQRKQVA